MTAPRHLIGLRWSPLARCLAGLLAGVASAPAFGEPPGTPAFAFDSTAGNRIAHAFSGAAGNGPAGPTLIVTSCADDGSPGTLRSVIDAAPSSATIDLRQLACSTITLETGVIDTTGRAVTLIGPGADRLTIDGDSRDRIFRSWSITIEGLTLSHGHASSDTNAYGGCIFSDFAVILRSSRVVSCSAEAAHFASGGGIFATYYADITSSVVSGNTVVGGSSGATGGGIATWYEGVSAEQSTISDNTATGSPALGGGIYSLGTVSLKSSTVANNTADVGGGALCRRSWIGPGFCSIVNSTVSGNLAHMRGGGWVAKDASLAVTNSTIAFNIAETGSVGGLLFTGSDPASIFLQSSIFGDNTAGDTTLAADIDSDRDDLEAASGEDNLLSTVGRIAPGFVLADPLLAPLAANGGPTQTHALLPGSPAIDAGNNVAALDTDQRGAARVAGAAADIGAYELQPDAIFADGFD